MNKKQVQFMRKELMKYDRRTQLANKKAAQRQQQVLNEMNNDDILSSMSNLMLKGSGANQFMNHSSNFMLTNMMFNAHEPSTNFTNNAQIPFNQSLLKGQPASKFGKGGNTQKQLGTSLLELNPHAESFLSFGNENDKTGVFGKS